jgi:hypothetical protein
MESEDVPGGPTSLLPGGAPERSAVPGRLFTRRAAHMTTVTIALPDGIFEAVRKAPDEVAQEMRIAVAVRWYAQGLISQGKGAEIAGLTRSQFIDALGLAGVPACQETISEIREILSRG